MPQTVSSVSTKLHGLEQCQGEPGINELFSIVHHSMAAPYNYAYYQRDNLKSNQDYEKKNPYIIAFL